MSRGWKITVMVVGVAGVVSTPLVWLLDSPDTGQLVGASVQAATGIAALVWALLQRPPAPAPAPTPVPGPADSAVDTGKADGIDGGTAHTGVRRPGGAGTGSAKAERTGDATAQGPGSSAGTGIDYS
ncbi:hypothetical protein OG978_41895 (plasmid) [Streptomyces sp. NBC_01591]|uniref:hypothetical protein n=1 Tax=Streptomyces sp. NBC_01591 TaxID=2975888 RepID=UPI002DD815D2|nr:hypothetical protein [Streptomyces sp. NBC_01591]WSD73762.1 hypothetical protein OG978_41895 [Streptomyces sp. NBC_01591]